MEADGIRHRMGLGLTGMSGDIMGRIEQDQAVKRKSADQEEEEL